jgi:hypothetical protein
MDRLLGLKQSPPPISTSLTPSIMKKHRILTTSLSLLLALPALAGKNQQLSSPDQVPEGLEKSDWASIRAAHTAWQHGFMPIEGGWQARNPGQQWTTKFDERGFLTTPREGDWTWGLVLESYGRGGKQQKVSGKPGMKAEGQRLSYQWDATLEEWWVNDQRGLEHGYTVARRPEGAEGSVLELTIATRGTLKPRVSEDALGLLFVDDQGTTVLTYSGLKVWDADGKTIASRFEAAGGNQLRLLVEEQGARYPLTIDPIAQQAYLKAGNNGPTCDDSFGCSVAVSGDTVVVGAILEDSSTTGVNSTPDENGNGSGAAYVFVRSGGTWSQQAYLKASNTDQNDQFGFSVAVSGDTVIVGANQEDSSTTGVNGDQANNSSSNSGAAYVFVRSGTTWSQQTYLKASNTGAGDAFGYSVALSDDTLIVGAYTEDSSTTGVNTSPNDSSTNSGAAYVFVRSGGNWNEQAYLKASNTEAFDFFGCSVSISGDTVVVGALNEASSATGVNGNQANNSFSASGAAYVFVRSGTIWSQQAYLKASNTAASDQFGYSVSVSGDTVAIGAIWEDSSATGVNGDQANNGSSASGAAYVFVRSGTTWSQQAYLKASNTGVEDFFGCSVAVSGDTVIVGAYDEDSSATGANGDQASNGSSASGAAYVFERSGTTWSQQAYLKASNTGVVDRFGISVAISADTVVVGALNEASNATGVNGDQTNNGSFNAGAAYVFIRSGTAWSQQAYIKASNTPAESGAGDNFGYSVAVSGDTAVVGAPNEDSSTTGANSTPNENAGGSGAAYVFVRSGTTWSQQAYLKASNTGGGDTFGYSVAISGDSVVIGAVNEDGSSTVINGNQADNSAISAGAAYVFQRSGGIWSQQAYLKASNTEANDLFGGAVAVSGDTVIVGAYWEDSNATGVNGNQTNNSSSDAGAAYVFVRSGTTWSQQAYLKASNTEAINPAGFGGDQFGWSVAVSGDTVIVGAPGEESTTTGVNSIPNRDSIGTGAAYVFVRNGTTWSQQAYLKASNTNDGDGFGISVSVSVDTVVVGASGEDSNATGVNGDQTNNSSSGAGAAYVFVRSGTTWSQQAYLKASNTGGSDNFGISVFVSGDAVVIGANREDSSTTGSNGDQINNGSSDAGAAYVFLRSGTSWNQQAYLKANNTGVDDRFGYSVAVSGDTVVVGAYQEDGSTTGINSTPNERASNAGAAYIFDLGTSNLVPEIAIQQMAFNLASGTTKDFGSVSVGSTLDLAFDILNNGTGDLTLSGSPKVAVSGSSDFSVTTQPAISVSAGGGTTFTVRFAPASTGAKSASLTILNNDADEGTYIINLTGTGTSAMTDSDGDGWSDSAETEFGGNPAVAGIVPQFRLAITPDTAPSSMRLRFPAAPGATHAIEGSVNLIQWQEIETGILGTGQVIERTLPMTGFDKRFFKVRKN